MADRVDKLGLQYFYNRIKTIFASKAEVSAIDDKFDDYATTAALEAVDDKFDDYATTAALNAVDDKVDALEGAEPNVIDTIKINGTAVTPSNKEVNINVPVVDNAVTAGGVNPVQGGVIKSYVDDAIASVVGVEFEIVQALPASGTAGTIYLVPNSSSGANIYDEYIYVSNRFEKIGSTDVDLTGYFNTNNLPAVTTAEIDTIVDGTTGS